MIKNGVLLSLLTTLALADKVEFNNGAILNGTVTEQDRTTLSINVAGTVTTYAQSDITNVEISDKVVSPPPSTTVDIAQTSKKENTTDILYPNRGSFLLADTEMGSMSYGLWTYARYSNQTQIKDTYIDEQGIEQEITQHRRNDIYLNKVNMQFKGWFLDERFHYLTFLWTSNSKYTSGGNIAVVGNLTFDVSERYTIGMGLQGLPTTREMELPHPRLFRTDMRTMAGEYFRASFAYGAWVEGSPVDDVYFRSMLANNMNAVGVDYDQLDDKMDTFSTGIWWMPDSERSELWYGGSFGDFEEHQNLSSRFGIHYTHSTETKQGQADVDAVENSQIRLSGGTPIFQSKVFTPVGQTKANLEELRFQLVAMDAGMKYRGFSLDGEVYFRHLDKFKLTNPVDLGFDRLIDTGFSIQPSYMVMERKLQLYAEASQIFSDQFTDPWSAVLGLNWFPIDREGYGNQVRVNADVQYSPQSPVGNASLPSVAHGQGFTYTMNVEMWF